nr:MAK10-like protein [Tanacetum cinerariifolium]
MGDENQPRTFGDYSQPSHEGYRNIIEFPEGNNVVSLQSDTIRLVQNPSFEARVQSYMAAHTKRMERFEDAISKQIWEINERNTEMFSLLKEFIKGKSMENMLVRVEISKPVTKYIKAVSLVTMDNDKSKKDDEVIDKSIVESIKMVEMEKVVEGVEDKDMLVDVAGFVYPMDFVILYIMEDEYMPLILGTSFFTTTRVEIKFDKWLMTLKAGRIILEWEERIKKRRKDEMRLINGDKIILYEESPKVLWIFTWMKI